MLGANVQPLLDAAWVRHSLTIAPIVKEVRDFLATAELNQTKHANTFYSLVQLLAFHCLPRHASHPPQTSVDAFAFLLSHQEWTPST